MSKKKNNMTPAEVANQLATFISKQEETLRRYPVGPLGNAARQNLKKGRAALAELKKTNETMRLAQQPQQQPQGPRQMTRGGTPAVPEDLANNVATDLGITSPQVQMMNYLINDYGYSQAMAAAVASVTEKESKGQVTSENSYAGTDNDRIRGINSRFKRKFKDMSDEDLNKLKADPEAFFNYVYGDDSGLGNTEPGDGYKFRGRGLVQITGRANYKALSQALYNDDRLLDDPDLLLDPETAGPAAAWFAATRGGGVGQYLDFDVSTENPTEEQLKQVAMGTYATIATGGTLSKEKALDEEYMAENYGQYTTGMPVMESFIDRTQTALADSSLAGQAFNVTQALDREDATVTAPRTELDALPTPEEDRAELDRRMAALQEAETQETLEFLRSQVNPTEVEEAMMTTPGLNRGYLGGTYGQDALAGYNPVIPDLQALETAQGLQQMQAERDATMTKDEQAREDARIGIDVLSPDFGYDEVLQWGEGKYGVSPGREGSGSFVNTSNDIIGANLYHRDRGNLIYDSEALNKLGGAGATVDETRVLLQALHNNGLTKEQAFQALEDPDTYKELKKLIPKKVFEAGSFGKHTLEMAQGAAEAADKWARETENREALAGVVDRGEEGSETYFATELDPNLQPYEQSVLASMEGLGIPIISDLGALDRIYSDPRMKPLLEKDRAAFHKKYGYSGKGLFYRPGAGGQIPATMLDPYGSAAQSQATAVNRAADPNSYRVEPTFIEEAAATTESTAPIVEEQAPTTDAESATETTPEAQGGEKSGTEVTEEAKTVTPPQGMDINNMVKGSKPIVMETPKMNYLSAIPAMASLASANIQQKALNKMQGPVAPILSQIPQFNYESSINQQLEDIRSTTNAMSQVDGLDANRTAANRQALMAERFKQEARVRAMDDERKQRARQQYESMALQARMAQDQIRNKFQDDRVAFDNQKAMLQAQIKQQPLDVLSASTQDYLKNVYAPNLAAQLEGLGRQYNTVYNTSAFDEDAKKGG